MCLVDSKAPALKINHEPPNQPNHTPRSIIIKQVCLTAGPFLLNFTKGLISGYSGILLPQLKDKDSIIKPTLDEATWIASAVVPTLAIGCILGGYVSEKFGRKPALTWTIIPMVASWVLIALSQHANTIIIGRFILGLFSGISGPAHYIYLSETCLPKYRGLLQTSNVVAMSLGILATHAIGIYATWQNTAYICAVFTLLCWTPFFFVPESPVWLNKQNRVEEAKKARKWINPMGDDAEETTCQKLLIINESNDNVDSTSSRVYTWQQFFKKARKPEVYKPFLIINFYLFIGQWSGNNMVCFYAVDIAKDSIGDGINEYLAVILIDIVRIISSTFSLYIFKRCPIRAITHVSGIGCTIALFGLAVSILYAGHLPSVVPFLFILSFIFLITIGLVPLPWNLIGEMYPLKVRGTCSGISMFLAYVAYFLLIKTGPYMFQTFGQIVSYCVFASVCLVGTIVLYFILPETSGKTLAEIENGFKKKKNKTRLKGCDEKVEELA